MNKCKGCNGMVNHIGVLRLGMNNDIKEILEEVNDIQVRYSKPLLKVDYINEDYTIERYEQIVFKMINIITNLQKELNLIKDIYTSMQFSAPENMYIFIEKLGNILEGENNEK